MIELTFSTAFMLYLCITMIIVLGVWIYHHYDSKKRRVFSNEEALRICEYCYYAYLEDSVKHVNQCPQCGLFNKQNVYEKK